MDKAQKYSKEKSDPKIVVNIINHIHLYKKIYLTYELLGLRGQTLTNCYYNINAKSDLEQTFEFNSVEKPRGKPITYQK